MRDLADMSVVITGASSGIGRATALAFAEGGARLTLASRRGGRLAALARECERRGARAQYVETNVSDPVAMRALAQAALRQYKRIDVWVNNAGVGAVGRFIDTPIEAHDQVIRTNLMGYLHGAHAALPHFQRRGQGVLINVNSFGAFVGSPFAASYTASKFGLRGLSESLRAELQDEPGIHICDIYPGVVDTPGLRTAGNYTGHELHASAPDRPEAVADAIVRTALRPRDKTSVGAIAKLAPLAYALAPGLGRWIAYRGMKYGLSRTPRQAPTSGNLFEPRSAAGGWAAPLAGVAGLVVVGLALVGGRR